MWIQQYCLCLKFCCRKLRHADWPLRLFYINDEINSVGELQSFTKIRGCKGLVSSTYDNRRAGRKNKGKKVKKERQDERKQGGQEGKKV